MRLFWLVTLFFLFISTGSYAIAATTRGGYPACESKSLFDEFIQAQVRNDNEGMKYLVKNGCFIMKGGLKISVLKTTFTGTAKIRVYIDEGAFVLWTNMENIVK